MVPSLPLLSCESSLSVKENPDRKKIYISAPEYCKAFKNSLFIEHLQKQSFADIPQNRRS